MSDAEGFPPVPAEQLSGAGPKGDTAGQAPADSAVSAPAPAPTVESRASATDEQDYPSMSSLWRRPVVFLNGNSVARGLLFVGLIILTILGTAAWVEDRSAEHLEVAENTSFVRQIAFDRTAEVKPFTEFNLHGARLWGLPLGCINLTPRKGCAELMGANLTEADLGEANLFGAFLHSADLSAAFMADTDLTAADLRNANLTAANLNSVILVDADVRNADLTGTTMIQANLRHADLRGTDFTGADMSYVIVSAACYDNATRWPDDFSPKDPPDCTDARTYP